VSQTSFASLSAFPSSSSTTSTSASVSALPSLPTLSATSSRSGTATSTTSGTSTSSYRQPDMKSPSPSPRPIVQIVFSLSNVQLSLFTDPIQQSSTLEALSIAVASAAGVASNLVTVRRVRDISNPSSPIVIWTNPQFAGDVFPARRRLSALGSVSFDSQITLNSNSAASSMSASLSSTTSKLAADVKTSLVNQGSPLSSAKIEASVQAYPDVLPPPSRDLFTTLMSTSNINVAVSITISFLTLSLLISIFYYCRLCFNKRRYRKTVAPAPEDDSEDDNDDNKKNDSVENNDDNMDDENMDDDEKNDAVNKSN